MRNQFIKKAALTLAAMGLAGAAFAQAPQGGGAPGGGGGFGGGQGRGGGAPGGPGGGGGAGGGQGRGGAPAAGGGSVAVANPTYVSFSLEVAINRPAADVWKQVGKFCDIGVWAQFQCMITSGKDGEIGAVRSVGREILVGKTELSYTYTQPVTAGQPYILYHGTMEARPVTATTSKMIYTLMWDNSPLADDAARDRDKTQRTTMVQGWLDNMKILAEGGTLPARGGGGGRGAGGGGGGQGRGGGAPGGGAGGVAPGGGRGRGGAGAPGANGPGGGN